MRGQNPWKNMLSRIAIPCAYKLSAAEQNSHNTNEQIILVKSKFQLYQREELKVHN